MNAHRDTPMRLWVNPLEGGGGPMLELGEERGLADRGQGRGLVTFDYDRDGDLDIVVANHAGRPRVFRNDGGNDRAWLDVAVRGTSSNRDGRGAVVRIQVEEGGPWQFRHVGVGSHFLGEGSLRLHFGLWSAAQVAHVEVRWPASGEFQSFDDVPANGVLEVVEP